MDYGACLNLFVLRRITALWMLGMVTGWACSVVPDLSKRSGSGPLFKIYRAGKFGYMDRTGRVVSSPRFQAARDFFGGLAAVTVNGQVGYSDENGNLVIPARFDDARDFREELAPVRVGRRWGYIDAQGRIAIEPQFQGASEYREGLARIYVWNTITLHLGGARQTRYTKDNAPEYAFTPVFEDACGSVLGDDGKFGFIDKTGRVVIPPRFAYAGEFFDGRAAVCFQDCGDVFRRRYGFVDRSGSLVIPPRYTSIGDFAEGVARVGVRDGHGFINRAGNMAIDPVYQFAGDFHDGLARVQLESRWGYIDNKGRFAIPLEFSAASDFREGLAVACSEVCTYIDRTGTRAVPGVFGNGLLWAFSDGLAPVMEDALFTLSGLVWRANNRIFGRPPRVVYVDQSANIVRAYEE